MRFGPKFREAGRSMIEEFEVLWIKLEATRGYWFQKFNDRGDDIFMLYSGEARMIVPARDMINEGVNVDPETQKHVVFGYLKPGDVFGE